MILPTILGEVLFWSPLVVVALLAIIIDPFYWTVFAAVYTVWVWISPAALVQFAFIMFFKWLLAKISPKWRKTQEKTE